MDKDTIIDIYTQKSYTALEKYTVICDDIDEITEHHAKLTTT